MLTEEEKTELERLFRNLNIKAEVDNQDDKLRITIHFRNGASLFTSSTYDFITKEELDKFIEPLYLIRQINVNSKDKIKIVPKSGLYQDGRYELAFLMGAANVNINDLRHLNTNLLNRANQDIHDNINKIYLLSEDINGLIRNYNDIKTNCNRIIEQVIKKQKSLMSLFKKIDTKMESMPLKSNETEQVDMASILELYTRNEFYRYGEDHEAVLVVEECVYSEIVKILLSVFNGKKVYINLRDYEELELEKAKKITDILLKSLTKYKEEVSKKVEQSRNKLDELIKHVEEKGQLKTLVVSQYDIDALDEPKVIKDSLNVSMNSNAMEKYDELSLDDEYKTTMLYSTMHDIEEKQNKELTKEERTGILIYKTQLYRAINPIISYIRKNNISFEEMYKDANVLKIIESAYQEMIYSSQNETEYKPTGISEVDSIFDKYKDNLGIPPIEDYRKIVLDSIPLIESAFNKISIEEDMVLYRGVPSNNETYLNLPNQYLSTSMSPRVALDFLERETNQKGQIKTFYKIILPAGSHALFYTSELLTGNLSSEELYPLYGDAQREVLIDTSMFDFEEIKRSQFYAYDYIDGYKTEDMPIEYIEIVAHPKTIEYKAKVS